jgi:hypothetical protein
MGKARSVHLKFSEVHGSSFYLRSNLTSAEAYDAYLKGVYFLSQESPDATRTAIRYFQAAIEKDQLGGVRRHFQTCYVCSSSNDDKSILVANRMGLRDLATITSH